MGRHRPKPYGGAVEKRCCPNPSGPTGPTAGAVRRTRQGKPEEITFMSLICYKNYALRVLSFSGSTNVYDVAQKTSACVRGGYEVLATVPQLPASTSVSLSQQRAASDTAVVQDLTPSPTPGTLPGSNPRPVPSTTPDPTLDPSLDPTLDPTSASHPSPILGPTPGTSSGPTPGTSSGPTPGSSSGPTGGLLPSVASGFMHTPPGIYLRNRRRREDPHLQFFEKRLQHEQGSRNRDTELEKQRIALEKERLAVEDRRITLEQDRLTLEREVFLQRKREWEEVQEEKRDERYERQREATGKRTISPPAGCPD
ncbi:hypothetical protein MTO96_026601 [Rhipicephalus appendiculatus]